MKRYNITIEFNISEKDYKRYEQNIDRAIALILPYGADYTLNEFDYDTNE